eukprot:tig00020904_g15261.t1
MLRLASSRISTALAPARRQAIRRIGGVTAADVGVPSATENIVNVTFVSPTGQRMDCKGYRGQSILEVAKNNNIHMWVNSCEGNGGDPEFYGEGPACTECHVIVAREFFTKLTKPNWVEEDLLSWPQVDATPFSRLGCQIKLTPELDGITVCLPKNSEGLKDHKIEIALA